MLGLGRVKHIGRYREVVSVLVKYGFTENIKQLGILDRFSLRRQAKISESERQEIKRLDAPVRARKAIEELGPTYVKLGQILSTRPDFVPEAYLLELKKLQDEANPIPWKTIRPVIEKELGKPLDEVFLFVESYPIGSASLAQVHKARLKDGTDVVIKVQRPDIEQTVETDLEILHDMARIVQRVAPLENISDLPGIVEDFGNTLRQEMDYILESENAEFFRENFKDESRIYVPEVYPEYTTRRLLVMEQIRGIRIDDVERLENAGYDRHRIAVNASRLIIKEVLLDGFFHADPHPGNLYVMHGEVIGVMDFGMVGWLDPRTRSIISQLYVSTVTGDIELMVKRLIQLDIAPPDVDKRRLNSDLNRLIRKYRGRRLRTFRASEFVDDITPIVYRHRLQMPTELWLLMKTLVIMEGVGLHLDPNFDIFKESQPFIRQLSRQQWSMEKLQKNVIKTTSSLQDLVVTTPELLREIERGDLKIIVEVAGLDKIFYNIGNIVNRVTTALLLAAMILGLAFLIPRLETAPWWLLLTVLIMFGSASFLGLWFIWTTIRGNFKR